MLSGVQMSFVRRLYGGSRLGIVRPCSAAAAELESRCKVDKAVPTGADEDLQVTRQEHKRLDSSERRVNSVNLFTRILMNNGS